MKLYKFQEKARDYLIQKKCALLAFQMGLGKTFISLAAAEKLGLPTLVICPAFMIKTWEKAISLFKINDIRIVSWSKIDLVAIPRVLIVDESHYAKSPSAKRTEEVERLSTHVRVNKNGYVWLLSGTPAKNTAAELYFQLRAVGMKEFDTYEAFADEFSEAYYVKYGRMGSEQKKYKGVRNLVKLRKLYEPYMWVMKTEEALELPQQIKKEIISSQSVFKEEDVLLYRSDVDSFMKKNLSTKKLQQSRMNLKQTKALIADLTEEFDKIIIFSDHVEPMKELSIDLECGLITGEIPISKRESIIEEFKKTGQFLCCTIGAAGVGLNLQFARCMVFNDLPWVPGDLMQAEKRIHRIGQTECCHYFYILDTGMGELIYAVLQKKIEGIDRIS